MSKLTYAHRKALPKSEFVIKRSPTTGKPAYPIDTENRARDALARVAQNGTPAEKKEVRAAVHRKFPDIGK